MRTKFQNFRISVLGFLASLISLAAVSQNFTAGNLAVVVAASNTLNNTTASVVEINTTTAGQTAITTTAIDGTTAPNSMRFSGSSTTNMYAANSNDGSLLCFPGHNSTTAGATNANTLLTQAVVTLNASRTVSVTANYTCSATGQQTRGATTLNNSAFFIGVQNGLYTNGSTASSPAGNFKSVKAFGGTVYVNYTVTPFVGTISAASGATVSGLPFAVAPATQPADIFLISSGSNGSAFDVLYTIAGASATVGTIAKYSLVSGSWVANGTYTTNFGGYTLAAKKSGTGAELYAVTGTGATAANNVIRLIDTAGHNTTLAITTASNITLHTAAAGTTIKGIAFAPVAPNSVVALSSPSQIGAADLAQGAVDQVISKFQAAVTSSNASLTSLAFTTAGTYSSSDIVNFKLYFNSTANTYPSGAVQVGSTQSAVASGGTVTFSSLSTSITSATTGYFFVTASSSASATAGNTINVAANPTLTFGSGTQSGSIAAGGTQTVIVAEPTIVISNGTVAAANATQNSTNVVLYRADVAVSVTGANLNAATFTTAGTYSASDITNLKLWFSTSSTFSSGTATLLNTKTTGLGGGSQVFGAGGQAFSSGVTSYLFVTADLNCTSTIGATLNVNAISSASNFVFATGTPSGSGFTAGGEQTFTAGVTVPSNVTAQAGFGNGTSGSISVSWTAPTGCADEIMIVAATATNTGTVSGNGSAYTANSAFGTGTGLGNGFVVFKGSAASSPQAFTGFTNGTTYYFKIFTRYNSTWSAGVEVNSASFTNITCTDLIVPQYMQGLNGTNANRVPTSFRVTLSGLTASTTYRFINQAVIATDLPSSGGAGNPIFVNTAGNFFGSSSPSLATPGTTCGTFTTDGTGAYTGWFALEPTGNATRFVPGNTVYMRFAINDGSTGTTALYRATTTNGMIVRNLGTAATDATGIRGTSSASPRDFICLYGNTSGSGRPISCTYVESDGYGNTASYAAFYYVAGSSPVEGVNGAWGAIIPNALPSGVRKIETRSLTTGDIVCSYTGDGLGVWGSTNTVDPAGGTTALVIASADAPMNCSSIVLDHTGIPQVTSAEILIGSSDNILSNFHLANTKNVTSMSAISFNVVGSFEAGDITNFKLYSGTAVNLAAATLLSTVSAASLAGGDAVNFTFSQSLAIGDRYFWITCDLTTAGSGRNVRVPALGNSAFTFAANADISFNTIDLPGAMTIGTPTPTVTVSDASLTVSNLLSGSTANVIQAIRVDVGVTSTTLSELLFNTTGAYLNGDFDNFKLYYQTSSSFNAGSATLLGTITTALTTGGHTFSGFTQTISVGTAYLFITADIPCSATLSAEMTVSAQLGAGLTVTSATATGLVSEKGPFTIAAGLPSNVTGATAAATGANGAVSVNWIAATGCYDQFVIVAAPATNTGTPSGDGSSYSANAVYTQGTALGNGYVVYSGVSAPQTITGMVNGTNYFFKIFTRNGTNWSSGVEVSATPVLIAAFTDIVVPQFIQGVNGTNANRLPFSYRGTISNLLPNATYRYYNSVVLTSAAATDNGAGNIIFPTTSGSWVRSTSPGLTTAGNYATFTSDANGSYTGWFVTEPTGNATRFVPGVSLKGRIMLNDGGVGTTIASRVTTTSSFTVVNTVAAAGANNGSVVISNSTYATPKNFVAVYDNELGTGRPLSMSYVESDGTANTAVNSFNVSYATSVDGITGSWGLIIPNTLANGVRRIEQRDFTTGAVVGCTATDADGVWGAVNTVNPASGPTALSILAADAPIFPTTPTWYVDVDFDGHYIPGTGITQCESPGSTYNPAATVSGDCDDNNAAIYEIVQLYVDADGDERTVGSSSSVCIGASVPVGYSATSLGTDCDDNDITVWQSATFYTDADGDGYHGSSAVICYGDTPPAGSTTTLGLDCNDSGSSINPGANEICDNLIDDDCEGGVDEYCSTLVGNDSPSYATNILFSTNNSYPNCYAITGNLDGASDSPQSATFTGQDEWYRFTAQSTGVSITLTDAVNDNVIELYQKVGLVYTLMAGGFENSGSGAGDFERLNYTGLTPGVIYYISVGAATGTAGGNYSLCIQHLMPSTCATAIPVGGLNLCDSYKAAYRGAASQGVTYAFNFTPNGATGGSATVLSGTNGLITLSNPVLGLRYNGTYTASVDVRYNLLNSASVAEPINVLGSAGGNCANVVMRAQPEVEVRLSQRCNASLLRSNWLVGNAVSGDLKACGVQNYTYEFTQVVSCADGTSVSVVPSTFNTTGAAPYLQLGALPNLGNSGAWNTRIRPNFSYGSGIFGPVQRIQVAGTSASGELEYELVDMEKEMQVASVASIYPNPSNGEFVNVSLHNLEKGLLQVRVSDATGRAVLTRSYTVDGSLQSTINFDQKLSAGVYMIEMTNAGQIQTQCLVVQ